MNTVNKPFRKKDAMQLVTGQPVYMDDVIPQDCLIVKLLRSPHANAMVRTINTTVAKKVPGIEAIFTWEDVPQDAPRYTQAGQTFPEASPRDRLLIDRHVRFVGDVVAIVAGKDEKCVDKALKLIKVEYEVLEPVLDFHTAKDNPILVHPEENWESLCPVGADNKRNLCAHDECGSGDIDAVLAGCDVVIDHVYHTKACQQAMMETFRTYCSIDTYGRLNVLSSTQIVFHACWSGKKRPITATSRCATARPTFRCSPVPLPGCRMAATGLRWVPARSRLCCMKNRQLRRSSWPKPSNNRWSPVPTCAAAPNTAAT